MSGDTERAILGQEEWDAYWALCSSVKKAADDAIADDITDRILRLVRAVIAVAQHDATLRAAADAAEAEGR